METNWGVRRVGTERYILSSLMYIKLVLFNSRTDINIRKYMAIRVGFTAKESYGWLYKTI